MVDSFAGTIGAYLVKELIEGAMALRLSAWSGLAFSHAEGLLNHAIDAAITSDPMEDLADMARYPIYREPFILLVPKGIGETVSSMGLEDILVHHRLIRHSARSHMGIQVERHLRRLGLEPPNVLEFVTSDALLAMVAIGIGVAVTTPLCLLQGATYAGDVDVIPLPGPGFSRELLFVARRGEFDSLGPRIAVVAQQLIRQHGLPKIYRFAPWLEDLVERTTTP
jgi:DNA-binding transcriptional LysR family regulator